MTSDLRTSETMTLDPEYFGDDLIITRATEKDFDEMLEYLNGDFRESDPITSSLNSTREEVEPLWRGN